MSLSIWSNEKNCFVLAPMKKEIINAFHPDYVKTYHPELLTSVKTQDTFNGKGKAVSKHITDTKKDKPSYGTIPWLNNEGKKKK